MEYSKIRCRPKQDQEIFPVECLRTGTKEYLVLGNTTELYIRLVFTVITQEIPVTQDFHIAMGIPEKVAEMIAEKSVPQWMYFAVPCRKYSHVCTNNIEVENLSEIRECLFDELITAFPTLNGYQLCGRRNKKKTASDVYTLSYSHVNGLQDRKLKQILMQDVDKLNETMNISQSAELKTAKMSP